jgi:hypothetical protein
MGLLDILSGNWTDDQGQNQAIRQGLLGAAFGAMAGRGTRLQAIGQGGLTGLMGYGSELDRQGQAKRQGFQDQIQRFQLETMKRQQADEEALRGAVRNSVVQPTLPQTMDNRDVGQPGEPSMLPRFDVNRYAAQLAQIGSPDAFKAYQALQKDKPAPVKLGRDDRLIDPETKSVLVPALPEAPKEDEFMQRMRAAGINPESPQGQALLRQYLTKQSTHAPAATAISYGSPVPFQLPNGDTGYVQPGNRPGAPPAIMKDPTTGVPMLKPHENKALTEGQAKAAAFSSQMDSAEKELSSTPLDPTRIGTQAEIAIAGGLGNFLVSPAAQRARQAQEQWAESYLRFKTGAASTEQEVLRNVRTFFPQPGDSKDVIQQKQRARDQAAKDVKLAAGAGGQGGSKQQAMNFSAEAIDAELARRKKLGGK